MAPTGSKSTSGTSKSSKSSKSSSPSGKKRASSSPSGKKRASSCPPSRSDPKRQATSQAVKGRKTTTSDNKATKQPALSSLGFSSTKRPEYQVGTKMLLDDTIYNDKVPPSVKGHFFVYEISSIDANGKTVTIEYKNQVITNGGDRFRVPLEALQGGMEEEVTIDDEETTENEPITIDSSSSDDDSSSNDSSSDTDSSGNE
jgi:hypothetical protein